MVAVERCCLFLLTTMMGTGTRILNHGGTPAPSTSSTSTTAIVPLIQDLRFRILRLVRPNLIDVCFETIISLHAHWTLSHHQHGEFLGPDGGTVDYNGLVASDDFQAYVHAAQQLQWADAEEVAALSEAEQRATWLNLYNALVMHALAVGPVYVRGIMDWSMVSHGRNACISVDPYSHVAHRPYTNTHPLAQARLLPRTLLLLPLHGLPRGGAHAVAR